ncbi:MAG TPA: hypothetical protein VGD43_05810 [Micromonospora sp.]
MGVPRRGVAVPVGIAAVLLTVGLTGCGIGPGSPDDPPTPTEDVVQQARERVQAYLDAVKAKQVAAGREQLCAPLQAAFDASATGPNGDFAEHFTVAAATIDEVRPGDGRKPEVSATVTVSAGGRDVPVSLVFTVARNEGRWCIADERQGQPSAAPRPS